MLVNQFDVIRLSIVFILLIVVYILNRKIIRSEIARLYVMLPIIGMVVFSVLSAAYSHIPLYIYVYNILFVITYATIFWLSYLVIGPSKVIEYRDINIGNFIKKYSHTILTLYLLMLLSDLVYPVFKIQTILSPPFPDLHALMFERFNVSRVITPIESLINYIQLLLTPLFFASLQYIRLKSIIFVSVTTIYLIYLSNSYISRGDVMLYLGSTLLFYWFTRPNIRFRISILVLILLPLFVYMSYVWMYVRLGVIAVDISFLDAFIQVFESQTNFADLSAVPLIESNSRINLNEYFIWIITLPIPKALFGNIDVVRINYEISEIVLGTGRGSNGFYINLPGVVAESVYIYGNYFFIHAASMSMVFYTLHRIIAPYKSLLFMNAYYIFMISYAFPRAGVSAILPTLLNLSILTYIIIIYFSMRSKRYGGT